MNIETEMPIDKVPTNIKISQQMLFKLNAVWKHDMNICVSGLHYAVS
jgi:hypothetical protein